MRVKGSSPTATAAGARGAAGPARCSAGPAQRRLERPSAPRLTLTGARTPAAPSRAWGLSSPTLSPNCSPHAQGLGRAMSLGSLLGLWENHGVGFVSGDSPAPVPVRPGPAHLGVGSLLQPPLLPLSLQPLELFPDFGWRPPPLHDLRAEQEESAGQAQAGRGCTPRAGTADVLCRRRPGPAIPSPRGPREVKAAGMSVSTRRPAPGPGEAASPAQPLGRALVLPKVVVSGET